MRTIPQRILCPALIFGLAVPGARAAAEPIAAFPATHLEDNTPIAGGNLRIDYPQQHCIFQRTGNTKRPTRCMLA